jgi:menaquinone-specific isochorismate synthase
VVLARSGAQASMHAHVELSAVGYRHDEAAERSPGRLVVRTIRVADPGDLIARLPVPNALAWVRRGDGLVGWGTAAKITLPAGQDRFLSGEKWLREVFDAADVTDDVAEPGTGPVAFGSFTFDPASDGSVLVVPSTVIGRKEGSAWLTTISRADDDGDAGDGEAEPPPVPTGVRWSDGSLTAPEWERAVAKAVAAISEGSLRKVVLALELYATAAADIDGRVLLSRLAGRYPECYTFACDGLLGATPELLIRRTGASLHSVVLAGTMPRGGSPEADRALGAALLASSKDRDEHSYAVEDVRAALQPLCADLRIDEQPSLLRLPNLQHLATQVYGELTGGDDISHSALALAAALHPTAAICGTPADKAMDLIRELEGMDRGRYSGPVGWVDARGNGEWGIALRCGLVSGRNARLFAGCGIVAESNPPAEVAEAQTKFWPMRYALEG